MAWIEEFPSEYAIPREIERQVSVGAIEDMSWRYDPTPSFGARLKDKNFVRLWVEHPSYGGRRLWPTRYTLMIQPDLLIYFGWRICATNDITLVMDYLSQLMRIRNPRWAFKIVKPAPLSLQAAIS